MVKRALVAAGVFVLAAVSCDSDPPLQSVEKPAVAFMDLPAEVSARCRREEVLAPACPTRVPQAIEQEGFHHRASAEEFGPDHFVFNAEWGAPHDEKINAEDRPPRFVHVTAHAGDLTDAFPFRWPGYPKPRGVVEAPDVPKPKDFGSHEWGDRSGDLVEAPPYPFGGLTGGHLIFRWKENGMEYALSLHSWLPRSETFSTLERVVESLPT